MQILSLNFRSKEELPSSDNSIVINTSGGEKNVSDHPEVEDFEKMYVCAVCSFCTNNSKTIQVHVKMHKDKPHQCSICFRCFKRKEVLRAHGLTHTGEKPFKCDKCDQCFTSISNLRRHQQRKHKNSSNAVSASGTENNVSDPPEVEYFENMQVCSVCSFCSNNSKILEEHVRMHKEKPHQCSICFKCFKRKEYLREHGLTHTGEKPFKCDKCDQCFTQISNLRRHQQRKHKSDSGAINASGTEKNLTEPSEVEDFENLLVCSVCAFCSNNSKTLEEHMRMHKEKPYQCSVCFKRFKRKEILRQHGLTHTGEKPFKCDMCDQCFSQNSNLRRHQQRKHRISDNSNAINTSGAEKNVPDHPPEVKDFEKMHVCSVCSFCSNNSKTVQEHMRMHKEKTYQCSICFKYLKSQTTLREHRLTHTDEKPFKCDKCDQCFTLINYLRRHQKRKH